VAVKAARQCGISRTARALCVDYYRLKKRVATQGDGTRSNTNGRQGMPTFLELTPTMAPSRGRCVVELEHARRLTNTISRPWGHEGPSPEEVWQGRSGVDATARQRFAAAVATERVRARVDLGLDGQVSLKAADWRDVDRMAISRALEQLGYLSIKRPRRKGRRKRRGEAPPADLGDSAEARRCRPVPTRTKRAEKC